MSVRKESLNSSQANKMCSKHYQKNATHQLVNKGVLTDSYFCQKCSIMLASQGYNVVKLCTNNFLPNIMKKGSMSSRNSRASASKPYPVLANRKNQIASFTQDLQELNQQLSRKIQYIQNFLLRSQVQYGNMIEETTKYYKQLQQLIELQKYTAYNTILNKRSMDQQKARSVRQQIIQAEQEVQAILCDINENMDAVETVQYSIYNTIIAGYQSKLQKIKAQTRDPIFLKPFEKFEILFPDISKIAHLLSQKITFLQKKSINSTIQNSIAASLQQKTISDENDVKISQDAENDNSRNSSEQNKFKNSLAFQKQSNRKNILKTIDPSQKIIKNKNINGKQLGFSFDQNHPNNNDKQVRFNEFSSLLISDSNYVIGKDFGQGKLSKIQQRMNSKQIYQSRQSLGQYLNISNSVNRHFAQDTQTLLIV